MRRAIALVGLAAAAAAAVPVFSVLPNGTSRAAAPGATFLVPAHDGYGVGDCLASADAECGRIIATAWCEAHGFARAESYGLAQPEDMTASVRSAGTQSSIERAVAIVCAN